MIGEDGKWKRATVKEARQDLNRLIFWRPNMPTASVDDPDSDPAFILEDIRELKRDIRKPKTTSISRIQ